MSDQIFVSYARNDLQGGELERFLQELERNVDTEPQDTYICFASYARADFDRELALRNLRGELEILSGGIRNAMFGDEQLSTTSTDYSFEIRDAVRRSQVLLAFVSPAYLESAWCAMERNFFTELRRPIFPVWWVPVDVSGLPEDLRAVQLFSRSMPASYAEHGLRLISRLRRYEDDYKFTLHVPREDDSRPADPCTEANRAGRPDRTPTG